MPSYRYLVVGGGMAADAAIGGVRQRDRHGAIGLIVPRPIRPTTAHP